MEMHRNNFWKLLHYNGKKYNIVYHILTQFQPINYELVGLNSEIQSEKFDVKAMKQYLHYFFNQIFCVLLRYWRYLDFCVQASLTNIKMIVS